ncbi:MAG: AAA family ATPase [Pseudomonadales bacterium]
MNKKTKTEWAKYWSSLGFSVVPVHYVKEDGSCSCAMGKDCPSPGKHPAPSRWKKYQETKADDHTLEMWFDGRFEKYNLGVVTGKVSGNVFVVDVDIGEGKPGPDTIDDLQMAHDDLPETLAQVTGSGGMHFFYRAPENIEILTGKNTLGDGVDTRGEGGFVVVAPSNHKSGNHYKVQPEAIVESPEWLREMSKIGSASSGGMNGSSIQGTQTDRWGDLVDGREGYMVQLLLGTIRTFWAQKGVLPTTDELVEEAWPTFEAKARARGSDLASDGRGIDLFRYKADYQLKRARNNELRILHNVKPGSETPPQTTLSSQRHDQGTVSGGIAGSPPEQRSLRISDWGMNRYSGEAPEQEWLIENILPRRVPGLVAAVGGLGKSFILLDLAMKVAGGDQGMHKETALGGQIVHNGKVVFLGAEDSANSMHRRISNISGPNLRERAAGNLFVVPMPDAGGPMPFIQNVMGQYSITPEFESIRQQLMDMGDIALVIIDPLQAFAAADINTDPAAAQFWWSLMGELCVAAGANVLIAHHMRKEGTFSIKKSVQAREAIRGTTALVDGARWVYGLWQMPESDELVVASKMGFEAGTGNCVMGGIVKVNDAADNSTRAFVRGESGLLIDKTFEVDGILEASAKLDKLQTRTIFEEINRRWGTDEPFAMATNTPRSLQTWMMSEYGMPRRAARGYVLAWSEQGYIESTTHDAKTKTKGIRVIRQPDAPSWGSSND